MPKDPYNMQFSKSDASAMSSIIKNGSLDFSDLRSGNNSGTYKRDGKSPAMISESEKSGRQSSPRSPVGRTDNKKKMEVGNEMNLKSQKISANVNNIKSP